MTCEAEIGRISLPPNSALKVAIIEDHREFCDYLVALVGGAEGFRWAGSFRSMEEALNKIGADPPDVALVDIGLPGSPVRTENSILAMKSPFSDDAATISSSN